MLTATIELWPYGDQSFSKRLVTICVANVGRSSPYLDTCNYLWTIDEPKPFTGDPISAQGVLKHYNRMAPCVDIYAAVLDEYSKSKGMSIEELSEYQKEICESMRSKTIKKP